MKVDDDMPYREGIVLDRPAKKGCGSFVNVGMRKEVRIDKSIKPGVRVTVKMGDTSGMLTQGSFPGYYRTVKFINFSKVPAFNIYRP